MSVSIVVFTRDLRLHDNPALHAAATTADRVVPLFVVDRGITEADYNRPNRAKFLAESLADLDAQLTRRGARLVVRHGHVADEIAALADEVDAGAVHMARDCTRYAARRQHAISERLAERRELHLHDSHVVIPPGVVTPAGAADRFSVFTPYHRRWSATQHREPQPAPRRLRLPDSLDPGRVPEQNDICPGPTSPDLLKGGETEGRRRAARWNDTGVAAYDDHDALARDNTSRLSPYLHFGCLSPVELVAHADRRRTGVDAFLRQICWRDFHHHVLAARP